MLKQILRKWKTKLFSLVIAISSCLCCVGSLTIPTQAKESRMAVQTFKQKWYNNGNDFEGWSIWDYPPSNLKTYDWVWLKKVSQNDTNRTVTYQPSVGWSADFSKWGYPYRISINGATQTIRPSMNRLKSTFLQGGTSITNRAYYNNGNNFTLQQGKSYILTFEVINGSGETASRGEIRIDVPFYKPRKHELAFDTNTGHIPNKNQINNPNGYFLPDSGYYSFESMASQNKYLHVKGAGTANGTTLTLYDGHGDKYPQARWYLERYENTPYYIINNDKANKYLSGGSGGNTALGTSPTIRDPWVEGKGPGAPNIGNNSLAKDQLWFFTKNSDGSITIHSEKDSNSVVGIDPNNLNNSSSITMQNSSKENHQKWKLVPEDSIKDYATKIKREFQYLYIPTIEPEKEGYTFEGWTTGTDGSGTKYLAGQNYTHDQPGGTVTVHAQWKPNKYDVNYHGNGGTWNGKDIWSDKATYDKEYVVQKNMFEKEGYEFKGWNTKQDGSGTDWTDKIGNSFVWKELEKVDLYAQWKPIQYQVVFNGNEHTSGSMQEQTLTYDKAEALNKNQFVKENADFLGWNTKAEGTGKNYKDQEIVKNLSNKKGDVMTLYAQWDCIPTLTTKNDAVSRYDKYTFQQILERNAKAEDREDKDLTNKIKIDRVEYPDGNVVEKPNKDEKMNTDWDTKKEIKVTVSVRDSYGHIVKKDILVTVMTLQAPGEKPNETPQGNSNHPSVYNRYIHKGYEWSIQQESIWKQNEEYKNELNEVLNGLQ